MATVTHNHPRRAVKIFALRSSLGVVEIGLAKRFFEAKAADARQKRSQGPNTLQAFQHGRCEVFAENTAVILNLNNSWSRAVCSAI
ncbi:hypothetical protein [Allofranklinella schreckenbergeri]|uniref:hypothetical protein n=1 Tax=Allofranklinella schreckenbergeri TaxID=1076744 RepID=UPI001EEF5CDB|nr:hypothetical protein [Allofranklinella schreckenbergeri]